MISLQAATGRQNLLDPSAELGVLLARNKLGSPGEGGEHCAKKAWLLLLGGQYISGYRVEIFTFPRVTPDKWRKSPIKLETYTLCRCVVWFLHNDSYITVSTPCNTFFSVRCGALIMVTACKLLDNLTYFIAG